MSIKKFFQRVFPSLITYRHNKKTYNMADTLETWGGLLNYKPHDKVELVIDINPLSFQHNGYIGYIKITNTKTLNLYVERYEPNIIANIVDSLRTFVDLNPDLINYITLDITNMVIEFDFPYGSNTSSMFSGSVNLKSPDTNKQFVDFLTTTHRPEHHRAFSFTYMDLIANPLELSAKMKAIKDSTKESEIAYYTEMLFEVKEEFRADPWIFEIVFDGKKVFSRGQPESNGTQIVVNQIIWREDLTIYLPTNIIWSSSMVDKNFITESFLGLIPKVYREDVRKNIGY